MGLFYEKVVRPILFLQEPEQAHNLAVSFLTGLSKCRFLCRILRDLNQRAPDRPVELFGVSFPNAVGLAAGMDKNAQIWLAAAALGFGHVEVGTVTLHRQPGNPRPRVFRYPREGALINRMGFNNDGAEIVANRLKSAGAHRTRLIPLGVNIGKSKAASLDLAGDDYVGSFNLLAGFADYLAINVSSPNTPELRQLQDRNHLPDLLKRLREANRHRARKLSKPPVPLLVKIAPDLTFPEIDDILETMFDLEYDGIIATNSTIHRPPSLTELNEAGGLTGIPLHERSVEIIKYIHHETSGRLPIIGVGGIHDVDSAIKTMDAGASLLQFYTGFIFSGPSFPKQIARAVGGERFEENRVMKAHSAIGGTE